MCRFAMLLIVFVIFVAIGSAAMGEDRNELGLYADPNDLSTTSLELAAPAVIELYLVLTNPYLEDTGEAVDSIYGFTCMIGVPENDIVFVFDSDSPFISVDQVPRLIVGFGAPVPVVDRQVVLGFILVLTAAKECSYYYLSPNPISHIPGHMTYSAMDATGEYGEYPMYPISGAYADPVFAVNGSVVPAESETWGGQGPIPLIPAQIGFLNAPRSSGERFYRDTFRF